MFSRQSDNTSISSVQIRRSIAGGDDDAERKIIELIDESQNRVLRYHQTIHNGQVVVVHAQQISRLKQSDD